MADKLSPLTAAVFKQLERVGRVRTRTNLERLYMIELKAFGLVEEPSEDVWQMTELAKMRKPRGA